ncbi:hypothetical protein CPT_Shaeky_065 [Streptomyces phage Shaeky]|uniref:Uncharacterized protein n=1 Tax=Streptomyces phage Shaeky TaxID=2767586 RepID=A0A873WLA1_9CAUD|nr:hypothetical protein CPT_Shaeky_065 [Streptomyces phage Shaeky]
MTDHHNVTGTRAEIIAALEERAEGWHHMASDRKRDRALEAAQSVREGADSVKVGPTTYRVAEGPLPAPRDAEGTNTGDPVT